MERCVHISLHDSEEPLINLPLLFLPSLIIPDMHIAHYLDSAISKNGYACWVNEANANKLGFFFFPGYAFLVFMTTKWFLIFPLSPMCQHWSMCGDVTKAGWFGQRLCWRVLHLGALALEIDTPWLFPQGAQSLICISYLLSAEPTTYWARQAYIKLSS